MFKKNKKNKNLFYMKHSSSGVASMSRSRSSWFSRSYSGVRSSYGSVSKSSSASGSGYESWSDSWSGTESR